MKAVFTGSRNWPFYNVVWDDLWDLAIVADSKDEDLDIYVGDCPTGVDNDVDSWIENHGNIGDTSIRAHYFLADWNTYGKGAGPRRNQQMVEAAIADGVENVTYRAYRLNGSNGTADAISRLDKAGVRGLLYNLTITARG